MLAGQWYVSLVRSSRQMAFLAGPFMTSQEARFWQSAAFRLAEELDGWVWFDAVGVVRVRSMSRRRIGCLNARLGLPTTIGDPLK